MPGMGSGLSNNDPIIVAAFHRALLHQGLVVVAILAVVAIAWNLLRSAQLRQAAEDGSTTTVGVPEPPARRFLRITFGLLWIFDGLLQGQASMPLGLPTGVIGPAAATSPGWVQHLTNAGTTIWTYHPVGAAVATIWLQMGIGIWLLAGPRGNWSRLAGVVSAGWAAVVWIFGEAFGGIFAPGLTWLFGAPGAVVFYGVAGVLVALPDRAWLRSGLSRVVLGAMGSFFIGMAILQAWPGRGFWQGESNGTLTGMVQNMAQTPQPHLLSSWVGAFAGFDAAHGWAVNLFVVVALAVVGSALLTYRRPGVVRAGVVAASVLCLADWVLIEDLGFMGGVGTDPNSMVPMLLVVAAGFVALTRPATATTAEVADDEHESWRQRFVANPAYAFRSVAAVGAVAITLVGAAPMALAATNRRADPILARAVDGPPTVAAAAPAPGFSLVDQHGETVSLAGLRGKTVALTFLDPVCTSDCPTIAQEFRQADLMLGPASEQTEFVAVDLNPVYLGTEYLTAFDQVEHLDALPNWRYLTGSARQLSSVWRAYGVYASVAPAGAMIAHTDIAYVIDASGQIRFTLNTDPGPGTKATISSFAASLASAIKRA